MVFYIGTRWSPPQLPVASLEGGHRLGYMVKLADLPKVNIRDLAHAGNRTPAVEFASNIDGH